MKEKFSLIMPTLGCTDASELPLMFQLDTKTGLTNCILSLINIDLENCKNIYFVIYKGLENKYHLINRLSDEINRLNIFIPAFFWICDEQTASQSETVYKSIEHFNIEGPIFIKDADNTCKIESLESSNCILTYSLEDCEVIDPVHKSYVSVDDHNIVTNVIEKKIVSDLFNCGGYGFLSADDFKLAYINLNEILNILNPNIRISHIIYWMMLNWDTKFIPIKATAYSDFKFKNL